MEGGAGRLTARCWAADGAVLGGAASRGAGRLTARCWAGLRPAVLGA
jgi:hypothetical protein